MTRRTHRRVELALAALCLLGAVLISGWRFVTGVLVFLGALALMVRAIAGLVLWWEGRDPDGAVALARQKRRERAG